jgi:hypothetical protein
MRKQTIWLLFLFLVASARVFNEWMRTSSRSLLYVSSRLGN